MFTRRRVEAGHSQTVTQSYASGRKWSLAKQSVCQRQHQQEQAANQTIVIVKQQISVYELAWDDLKGVLLELFPTHPIEFVEDVSDMRLFWCGMTLGSIELIVVTEMERLVSSRIT